MSDLRVFTALSLTILIAACGSSSGETSFFSKLGNKNPVGHMLLPDPAEEGIYIFCNVSVISGGLVVTAQHCFSENWPEEGISTDFDPSEVRLFFQNPGARRLSQFGVQRVSRVGQPPFADWVVLEPESPGLLEAQHGSLELGSELEEASIESYMETNRLGFALKVFRETLIFREDQIRIYQPGLLEAFRQTSDASVEELSLALAELGILGFWSDDRIISGHSGAPIIVGGKLIGLITSITNREDSCRVEDIDDLSQFDSGKLCLATLLSPERLGLQPGADLQASANEELEILPDLIEAWKKITQK